MKCYFLPKFDLLSELNNTPTWPCSTFYKVYYYMPLNFVFSIKPVLKSGEGC